MKISSVIGLNYGDEGKGKVVDLLAHNDRALVIRSSGGANCGHTVVHNGTRHVFHSFGSATFRGIPTHCGPNFILNPTLLMAEFDELLKLGVNPEISFDLRCRVTFPFDVYINQALERGRKKNRHGSCGVGLGETVQRCEEFGIVTVEDLLELLDTGNISSKLMSIYNDYSQWRMRELRLFCPKDSFFLKAIERFVEDFQRMNLLFNSSTASSETLSSNDHLIFEGNQGLCLDQNSEDFPHVTRANCGIKDHLEILKENNISDLPHVYYITRCYSTRHGAGPFDEIVNPGVVDGTNVVMNFKRT